MVGCGRLAARVYGRWSLDQEMGAWRSRTSQFFLQSTFSISVSAPLQPPAVAPLHPARQQLRAGPFIASAARDPHHGPVYPVRDQVRPVPPPLASLPPLTCKSAGYALFKAHNKKLLKDGAKDLGTVEGTVGALKLKKFTVQLL